MLRRFHAAPVGGGRPSGQGSGGGEGWTTSCRARRAAFRRHSGGIAAGGGRRARLCRRQPRFLHPADLRRRLAPLSDLVRRTRRAAASRRSGGGGAVLRQRGRGGPRAVHHHTAAGRHRLGAQARRTQAAAARRRRRRGHRRGHGRYPAVARRTAAISPTTDFVGHVLLLDCSGPRCGPRTRRVGTLIRQMRCAGCDGAAAIVVR